MKRELEGLLVVAFLTVGLPVRQFAQGSNPLKVATLHWYSAGEVAQFAVGSHPSGLVFDGENMWVINEYDVTVTKVRTSDGSILGTFPLGAATTGGYGCFDGANVWITGGNAAGIISKIRASDGALLLSVPVGSEGQACAFDGTSIWVAVFESNTVVKLRPADGTVLGTFPVARVQ